MSTVAVIDYEMGNLHSVAKALESVAPDARVEVTGDPERIARADRVVFPGVGAIRDCMREIRARGLDEAVARAAEDKPMLAICVGLQALMEYSEENDGVACLDIFPGQVRHFGTAMRDADGVRLKVPHMGWNEVWQRSAHRLWKNIPDGSRFYFVHSYYVQAGDRDDIAGEVDYGVRFTGCLARDNVFATQFHPEKSQRHGLALLRNFVNWDGST